MHQVRGWSKSRNCQLPATIGEAIEVDVIKISELSAKTGLSPHTLRFYEKHGLIRASSRSDSGYRYYSEADVRRVDFVRAARNIGFSLEDIGTLLSIRLDKQSHTCQEVTDITRAKLEAVQSKIVELQSMQQTLQILLESCCGGPDNATHCSIMEALDEGLIRQGLTASGKVTAVKTKQKTELGTISKTETKIQSKSKSKSESKTKNDLTTKPNTKPMGNAR